MAALADLDGGAETAPRREGRLDRHGRLDADEQRRVARLAITEVVRPAARAMLGAALGDTLPVSAPPPG